MNTTSQDQNNSPTFKSAWTLIETHFIRPLLSHLHPQCPALTTLTIPQFTPADLIKFNAVLFQFSLHDRFAAAMTSALQTILKSFYTQQSLYLQNLINSQQQSSSTSSTTTSTTITTTTIPIYQALLNLNQQHQSLVYHFNIVFHHLNQSPVLESNPTPPSHISTTNQHTTLISSQQQQPFHVTMSQLSIQFFRSLVLVPFQTQIIANIRLLFKDFRQHLVSQLITSLTTTTTSSSSTTQTTPQNDTTITNDDPFASLPQIISSTITEQHLYQHKALSVSEYVQEILPILTKLFQIFIDSDPIELSIYRILETQVINIDLYDFYHQLSIKYGLHHTTSQSQQIIHIGGTTSTSTQTMTSTNDFDSLFQLSKFFTLYEKILKTERLLARKILHPSTEPMYMTTIHNAFLTSSGLFLHQPSSTTSTSEQQQSQQSDQQYQYQHDQQYQLKPSPLFTNSLVTLTSLVLYSHLTTNSLVQLARESLSRMKENQQIPNNIDEHSQHLFTSIIPEIPVLSHLSPISLMKIIIRTLSVIPSTLTVVLDGFRLVMVDFVQSLFALSLFPIYNYSSLTQKGTNNELISNRIDQAVLHIVLSTSTIFLLQLNSSQIPKNQQLLIPSLLLLTGTFQQFYQSFTHLKIVLTSLHATTFKELFSTLPSFIQTQHRILQSQQQQQSQQQSQSQQQQIQFISKLICYDHLDKTSTNLTLLQRFSSILSQINKKSFLSELTARYFDLIFTVIATSQSTTSSPSTTNSIYQHLQHIYTSSITFTIPIWKRHLIQCANFVLHLPNKDSLLELHCDLFCQRVLSISSTLLSLESFFAQILQQVLTTSQSIDDDVIDVYDTNATIISSTSGNGNRIPTLRRLQNMVADVQQSIDLLTPKFIQWYNQYQIGYYDHYNKMVQKIQTTPNIFTSQLNPKSPSSAVIPYRIHNINVTPCILSILQWPKSTFTLDTGNVILQPQLYVQSAHVIYNDGRGNMNGTPVPIPLKSEVLLTSNQIASGLNRFRAPTLPFPLNDVLRSFTGFYYNKYSFRSLNYALNHGFVKMDLILYQTTSSTSTTTSSTTNIETITNQSTSTTSTSLLYDCQYTYQTQLYLKLPIIATIIQSSLLLLFNPIYHLQEPYNKLSIPAISRLLGTPIQYILDNVIKPLLINKPLPILVLSKPNGIGFMKYDPQITIDIHSLIQINPYYLNNQFQPQSIPTLILIPISLQSSNTSSSSPTTTTTPQQLQQQQIKERTTRIFNNRNLCVDGAITRVMKRMYAHNEDEGVEYTQLFEKVQNAVAIQFELDINLFKQRLEHLINNDFIIRDDNDHTLFYYNP